MGRIPVWKTVKDVKSLTFSSKRDNKGRSILRQGRPAPVKIGGYALGNIYVGRLRFKDGSVQRVAIKRFKGHLENITDEMARNWRNGLKRIRAAGVEVPKVGLIKVKTPRKPKGELVQVMQLFGSVRKGSKIENKAGSNIKTPEAREQIIRIETKCCNAGYELCIEAEPFKDQRKGSIPLDLDSLFDKPSKSPPARRAFELVASIHWYGQNPKEIERLLKIALETANPTMKKAIKVEIQKRSKDGSLFHNPG
ncbi:hypothetical protein HZB88_03845 [archaeon]|nr:hypothetical protein [archaeon]